jgi:CRISPR type III-A-associated RAMP protein Csm4
MIPAFLIRLYPAGPWRFGPGEGGRDRVDTLYRSDRLFSALTLAFERMGMLDRWLDATARAESPAVTFSSLFPFQGDALLAPPPATLWPPPPAAVRISSPVFSTKVRWHAARFVPLSLIETLLTGQRILADQWIADAESGCLLRRDRPQSSPFRIVSRSRAAVDRLGSGAESHSTACIEFEPASGLWTAAAFQTEDAAREWKEGLNSAFRLIADSGLGGRRSSGWGQIASFEVQEGFWPGLLLPRLARSKNGIANSSADEKRDHWLLSLFTPAAGDQIDWSAGSYSLTLRGGRTESSAGHGIHKRVVRMVEEGSVVSTEWTPRGSAVDVAPEGFAHPVYRAGFALSIALPAVTFGAGSDESAQAESTDLEKALDEALRAAAGEVELPQREPADEKPEEATDHEAPDLGQMEETRLGPSVEHTGTTEQKAPQTPFDEPPALPPDSEYPERLSVETPASEEINESTDLKPERGETGSGNEI